MEQLGQANFDWVNVRVRFGAVLDNCTQDTKLATTLAGARGGFD